jgi:hypothetical protein
MVNTPAAVPDAPVRRPLTDCQLPLPDEPPCQCLCGNSEHLVVVSCPRSLDAERCQRGIGICQARMSNVSRSSATCSRLSVDREPFSVRSLRDPLCAQLSRGRYDHDGRRSNPSFQHLTLLGFRDIREQHLYVRLTHWANWQSEAARLARQQHLRKTVHQPGKPSRKIKRRSGCSTEARQMIEVDLVEHFGGLRKPSTVPRRRPCGEATARLHGRLQHRAWRSFFLNRAVFLATLLNRKGAPL